MENAGWNFDEIRGEAEKSWNHYLSKIEVEGDNADRITQFYTHLYRTMIHPNVCSDVNGEYMGADNRVYKSRSKQYTSFLVIGILIVRRFSFWLCWSQM